MFLGSNLTALSILRNMVVPRVQLLPVLTIIYSLKLIIIINLCVCMVADTEMASLHLFTLLLFVLNLL